MNTVLNQSTIRAQGLALGLLLMTALAVGTMPARADEVTAYGAYPARQLAEQRSALDASMQRTAELAQRALAAQVKLSLKQQARPTKVAMTIKQTRGRG